MADSGLKKRPLSWKRASIIAWRDLKSAPGKFLFVVLSVAIGVAALVGVRGFSDSFRSTLGAEARSLIGGDLNARVFGAPTPEQLSKVAEVQKKIPGSRSTWIVETISMASVPPDPVPLLVSLKAVDPAEYPYYGEAELAPAMTLQQALAGDSVVVADEFLIRMNAHVGQTLRLGGKDFRIAAVLQQEPDRMSAGAGIGPRVMISRAGLDSTQLLAPGSRASQRMLFKLPASLPAGVTLQSARHDLEAALPDAQVMDHPRGQSCADRRPRPRHGDSLAHLPCGNGAWRHRRGNGDARAPRTAHGYAGDFEGHWRGLGRFATNFSAAKRWGLGWLARCWECLLASA